MAALNAPKPDADRRRRNAPTFAWVMLPADGRTEMPPELPAAPGWLEVLGGWPLRTVIAWSELWRKPEATQWDETGTSLHGWAELHALGTHKPLVAAERSEMRQIEDRHGLSPRARLALRWRVEEPASPVLASVTSIERPTVSAPKTKGKDPRNGRASGGKTRKDPRL